MTQLGCYPWFWTIFFGPKKLSLFKKISSQINMIISAADAAFFRSKPVNIIKNYLPLTKAWLIFFEVAKCDVFQKSAIFNFWKNPSSHYSFPWARLIFWAKAKFLPYNFWKCGGGNGVPPPPMSGNIVRLCRAFFRKSTFLFCCEINIFKLLKVAGV